MVGRTPAYALLAGFLDYPDERYLERVESYAGILESGGEDEDTMARLTSDFRAVVQGMPIERIQELYTRTFDINPVCTLEVGWHVYGEDYARGEFLVKMKQLLKEYNLPESTELPDHLTHVLAILAQLEGEEADFLASRYLLPALGKMLEGFQDGDNPYRKVLEAIVHSVRRHHEVEAVLPRGRRGDPPGSTRRLPIVGNLGGGR